MTFKKPRLWIFLIVIMAGCSGNALNLSKAELCAKAQNNREGLILDMSKLDPGEREKIDRMLRECNKG